MAFPHPGVVQVETAVGFLYFNFEAQLMQFFGDLSFLTSRDSPQVEQVTVLGILLFVLLIMGLEGRHKPHHKNLFAQ